MSFSNLPLQTRTKATRSRWRGSMLACNLKTKPLKPGRRGSIAPWLDWRATGFWANSKKASKKGRTPKLVIAEPKKTGLSSPPCTSSRSKSAPAPSSSSSSSRARASRSGSTSSARSGSFQARERSTLCLPRSARANRITCLLRRSITPRKRSPLPIGQLTGQQANFSSFSISSISSRGSRPGRSILLIKVKIGIWRMRQTSNNLRVWGSSPLAASSSITALSAAAKVR